MRMLPQPPLAFRGAQIYNPRTANPDNHFAKRVRAARTIKTYLELSDRVSLRDDLAARFYLGTAA